MSDNSGDKGFVRVKKLKKAFFLDGSEIVILDDIDFSINRGEMVGIVGSSGAGKSTFLYLLGGLDKPTSGEVLYNDIDIFKLDEEKLAHFRSRKIGFVFQSSQLLSEFSAEENVALAGMILGQSRSKAVEKSREYLKMVGLEHRFKHRPGKLSGGEQQRVAIARALVNEPDIVLADEPTGNLDSTTGAEIFEIIMKLNQESRQSFIIVTHNMDLAKQMSKVARIKDGKFVYNLDDMLE